MLVATIITEAELQILQPYFKEIYLHYFKRFTLTGKVHERFLSSNGNN